MTRREAWLSAGLVAAVALVARAIVATAVSYPVPEDTAYYVGVARNVLDGHGMVADALWSYQTPPLTLPHPAFEIWLPLPSLVAGLPMALFGATFRAAQVGAVLVGTLVPVLAWRLAADVATERGLPPVRARVLALGAGLLVAIELPTTIHGGLPDSTMPFAALVLGACLLMARILAAPRRGRLRDPRLVALGVVLGVAALCRNEALWLALTWAGLAWWCVPPADRSRALRLRLIAVPAVVAIAVYLPWAIRDLVAFGSPLPGQAASNALSVRPSDIFAWHDVPTVARYLAQGPAALVGARVDGFLHNLLDVLVIPGIPIAPIALVALPRFGGGPALRPLLVVSVAIFAATTLLFPVSTQWGTFLHAAGAIHVLLAIVALLALDALVAAVARRRAWTRSVAWAGPALLIVGALPLAAVGLVAIADVAGQEQQRYADLGAVLARLDGPAAAGPIIGDHPVWIAESLDVAALGLPDESPPDVLDLARRFGATLVVVTDPEGSRVPEVLASGAPEASCYAPVPLADPATGTVPASLEDAHLYAVTCR